MRLIRDPFLICLFFMRDFAQHVVSSDQVSSKAASQDAVRMVATRASRQVPGRTAADVRQQQENKLPLIGV
jgi:hypothetical protein